MKDVKSGYPRLLLYRSHWSYKLFVYYQLSPGCLFPFFFFILSLVSTVPSHSLLVFRPVPIPMLAFIGTAIWTMASSTAATAGAAANLTAAMTAYLEGQGDLVSGLIMGIIRLTTWVIGGY